MKASMAAMVGRDEDRPGAELVPGYRLLARVGSGGAGEVWSAEAPGGLRVALKVVQLTGRLGRREVANVRILRAIRHPNLLAYFGAWQHRGRLIIGMELADGSLWDRLADVRGQGLAGIPLGELLEIIGEVAKVIDFLNEPCHELEGRSGVAIHHRDIKPQNIMLIGRGVKVADFGLSCLDDPTGATRSQCGLTFAYAAPEIFRRQVSASSDQYSLAVTYCQLRGGRLPFVGPPAAVMLGHLSGDPDLSMLPGPERPIIERAMAKDPRDRWPDCRSLVKALVDCAEAGTPDTLTIGPECPEESVEWSGSAEIPPLPAGWEGSASVAWDDSTGTDSLVDESVYWLDGPATAGSCTDVADGASASPTVMMAELSGLESRRVLSRFGVVAASILAAGLAAWSWSERIATRAAIPSTRRSMAVPATSHNRRDVSAERVETPSPGGRRNPAVIAHLDRPDRLPPSPTRRPDTAPPTPGPSSRAEGPVPRSTAGRSGPHERTLDDSARMFVAARLADVSAWRPRIREASAMARTWLASLSTTRRPAPAPRAIASTQPARPGAGRASPTELRVGTPDVLEIEAGRSAPVPIRVDRAGHGEALSVHFEGLPTGVTIPDATIPAGQDRAEVMARARLDAPATTTPVAMAVRAGSARGTSARLRVRVRANPAMLSRTRGHTLLACGRHPEAVAAFTEAIQAGVRDAYVYNNRGLAYSSIDQVDLAIRDYTEAIRLSPTDATIRYNRGMAFARRGDDFRALLDFDTAIRLRCDDFRAYEARARIYRKHGDMARSCADSGRASELARAARPDGQLPPPRPP